MRSLWENMSDATKWTLLVMANILMASVVIGVGVFAMFYIASLIQ